jgi:hypothetical protein
MKISEEKLDEFGLNRKDFEIGENGSSKFFKLKDGEKVEVTFKKGGISQVEVEFKKFDNGQTVKDEEGNDIVERKGYALRVILDSINNTTADKTWDITSKKLAAMFFSFLDKREKDGTPYLFSRKFLIERKGTGTATTYVMFPTDPRA